MTIYAESPPCTELLQIPVDQLTPDLMQPRKSFLENDLQRLADSISIRGILQPLRVRYSEKLGKWIIVIGESRYQAGRRIGITHFPCIPMQGDADEIETLIDQLAENDCRSAIPPTQHARGLARIKAAKKWTGREMAEQTGMSQAAISKALKLLKLPLTVQKLIDSGHIPAFAGYELGKLEDDEASMQTLADAIAAGELSGNAVVEAVQAVLDHQPIDNSAKPQRERLNLPHARGKLSLVSDQPLTWDVFDKIIDDIRRVAKVHRSNGQSLDTLADLLRKP